MIWRRGAFELEVEWDHGPDVSIIFYGHRTHIFGLSYNAYPVLGGIKQYTIEDLYRDSPTETPFRKMVEAKDGIVDPMAPYAVNTHPPGWRPPDIQPDP